jgi:hypothetical protein
VDRNALMRLLGTALPEEVSYAPVGSDVAADTVVAVKPLVTSLSNGEQTRAREARG